MHHLSIDPPAPVPDAAPPRVAAADDLLFRDEPPAGGGAPSAAPPAAALAPWKIAVVDDDPAVHAVSALVLRDLRFRGRPLQLLRADSGAAALALMRREADIAVLLLDVVMETDDAGLRVVRHVREALGNRMVRIILRTGQPGRAPEHSVIADYDINDYKDKAELTAQKLITSITVALRGYEDLQTIRALASSNEALESLVGERTQALALANAALRAESDERLAALESLRRSRALLAQAQQIAGLGHYEWTPDTDAMTWSDELHRLLGKVGEPASREALFEAIVPEDELAARQAFQAALETRSACDALLRLRGERGAERWAHLRCTVECDAHGRLQRAVGTLQDVTARQLLEQALRAAEARFRLALDSLIEGCAIIDFDSTFRYVNEAAARMLLCDREAAIGRSIHDIWAGFASAPLAEPFRRGLQARESQRFEIDVPQPDGSLRSLEVGVEPVPEGIFVLSLDITERKRAEAALHQLNRELEQHVMERTAELVAARDEAERANRVKSEFLSRMSHELRTPMNAVLGFGQILVSDAAHPLPSHQHDQVRLILRAARHLLELINEVLDLARIEAGKLQLQLEPVAVEPLLADCLALMQPVADDVGVLLPTTIDVPHDAWVTADATRLRQVLLNLLSNAVKYNRRGGSVRLRVEPLPQHLVIAVADTGHGLDAAQRARLFQAFERLDADQRAVQGTGIGLALSRHLVELMGGEIGMDSIVGQGSVFRVRLPRCSARPAPVPASAGPRAALPAAVRPACVLYVEDDPVNTVLMDSILQRLPGLSLLTAPLPELGLELARTRRPDLVLLDIQLPGVDGFEVLRRLRADPATRTLPVVAISANAMRADVERGRAAGFDAYLTKPLEIHEVLGTVARLIGPP